MTSALSNWYHNQYSTWNRTRRMQASPFVARAESQATRLTRTASRAQTGDTVINMGDLLPNNEGERTNTTDKKKQDTLFGPSIGIVDPGPSWADHTIKQSEKPPIQDVLTPELVKNWVEKSKEASQPTTTLQALVNLKRPSLKLSPISHEESENEDMHHHGLEFQFDCDAPKCGISLIVVAPPSKEGPSDSSPQLINLFNAVVEGGFGRVLKLEEGATLELAKYDPLTTAGASSETADPSESTANLPSNSSTSLPSATPEPDASTHHKKRFTLRIRKRTHPHAAEDTNQVSVAGPALQVVDVETPSTIPDKEKDKEEGGVKVMIKLEALDEHEHSPASPNSQTTYLHIVRLGTLPAPPAPDNRPWVVRVVKREATIGPHTFHLHEIYGLTSHTSAHPQDQQHTYPPTTHIEDDPTSECLLCLSSPREVVLLPCRHLVACKECAVNMVEFGAGGQLVHTEEAPAPVVTPAGDATPGDASAAGEGSGANAEENPPPTPAPAPARQPRRKRKPKGWFCPVCRQPYTSLLRISTTAPVKKEEEAVAAEPTATTPQRTGIFAAISNAVTGNGNAGANTNPAPVGHDAV